MVPAALAAFAAALVVAQPPGPGETPLPLRAPGVRVHLFVSEEIHPDALGALARPGVTLWLATSSNALRPRLVERLRRFDEAWIQIRPPPSPVHGELVRRAPAAGLWLRGEAVARSGEVAGRLGARRLAVDVDGALAPQWATLRDAARLRWSPGTIVPLADFAEAAQLPGAVALVVPRGVVPDCAGVRPPPTRRPRVVFVAPGVEAALGWARCGVAVRARVDPGIDEEALRRLTSQVPDVELEVEVGADDRRALAARRLLERLGGVSGRGPRASGPL